MGDFSLQVGSIAFDNALDGTYDIGVGIVGYEARATFCPLRFAARSSVRLALRYLNKQVRSFKANNAGFDEAGFNIFDLDAGNECFTTEFVLKEALSSLEKKDVKLVVDISSMSRTTMAGVFAAIMSCKIEHVEVVFTYAVASFENSPSNYPPLVEFGAVNSAFGGAPRGADKFTALVLGVGYEAGRAISAYSQMEAEETWILVPVNADKRYNDAVSKANKDLLALSEKINSLYYDVSDPLFLYEKLRTLALGLRRDHRLVFIPSGPKICALVTFLVALEFHPDISIWRMSSGPLEPLFHRNPSGSGIALSATFTKKERGKAISDYTASIHHGLR